MIEIGLFQDFERMAYFKERPHEYFELCGQPEIIEETCDECAAMFYVARAEAGLVLGRKYLFDIIHQEINHD